MNVKIIMLDNFIQNHFNIEQNIDEIHKTHLIEDVLDLVKYF